MISYLGIDPGSSSGCIAIIALVGGEAHKSTMEFSKLTTKDWFTQLREYSSEYPCKAVLEKVHGMPGMGVSSVSAFMKNVGHIEMALLACNIPFTEVTPQTWMRFFNLKKEKDESKTEWKRRLREHLQRIMPDFKATNDTADAMLIAYYAMKTDR